MTDIYPGEIQHYLSADSTEVEESSGHVWPTEFLNNLAPNGIPPHDLALKKGMPLVVLRNISPRQGMCNGTRVCINQLQPRVLECKILNGTHKGNTVFIPRVTLRLTESTLPFTLIRRQFPVRVAFAMTVNKSQGQTINHVGIYLPHPVFSHGQLYVALSRCPSFSKLNVYIEHGPTSNHTANVVYTEIFKNDMIHDVIE